MALFDPAHPGELIRETLEAIRQEKGEKLTIEQVAKVLGTTRKTLSAIINGKQSITTEMAIRLEVGFPNTTAEFWLKVQETFDLSLARKKVDISHVCALWQPSNFQRYI
jgi:antitoxin HigA-1